MCWCRPGRRFYTLAIDERDPVDDFDQDGPIPALPDTPQHAVGRERQCALQRLLERMEDFQEVIAAHDDIEQILYEQTVYARSRSLQAITVFTDRLEHPRKA